MSEMDFPHQNSADENKRVPSIHPSSEGESDPSRSQMNAARDHRPTDPHRGKLILSTKYCRRRRRRHRCRVDRNDVMQISANNGACHRGRERGTEGANDAMSKVRSRVDDGPRNGKKWPSISGPTDGRACIEGGREAKPPRKSLNSAVAVVGRWILIGGESRGGWRRDYVQFLTKPNQTAPPK